jgi:hypothetical protein
MAPIGLLTHKAPVTNMAPVIHTIAPTGAIFPDFYVTLIDPLPLMVPMAPMAPLTLMALMAPIAPKTPMAEMTLVAPIALMDPFALLFLWL